MSVRGTAKQYIFEIANNGSLESARKLREMVILLSEQNIQEEVISSLLRLVSSGSGRAKLLSQIILLLTELTVYHQTHKYNQDIVDNVAAVFYAVTTNDSLNILVRVLAYSSLSEISSAVKKVDYLHMFSTTPPYEFLMNHHNSLLVSGAVTPEQQDLVVKRLSDSKHVSTFVIRRCIAEFPPEKTKELLSNLPDLSQSSPYCILFNSTIFSREVVIEACKTLLKTSNIKPHVQSLAFHVLSQERTLCPEITEIQPHDSHETIALKLIAMSHHDTCEESGQMMSALRHFHRHFFYKIGGAFPSLFFRVVWNVYNNSEREQTRREIEQTVKIMLFDQPKYALYAVNFLNSIPFSSYSSTLLEVLLQLVEFIISQPFDQFVAASEHYIVVFQHYLSLKTYSPTPIIRYCTKVAESHQLDHTQIVSMTDMVNTTLLHSKLSTVTAELGELCGALSRFPLHQSFMLLLQQYLTTYSTTKLQASLFGATQFSSQDAGEGGTCSYLERPMLKLNKMHSTIARKKYVNPTDGYKEFDTVLYTTTLHLTITLSYCVHLAREEEYLTCPEFQFTPQTSHFEAVESVFVPVLRSGDTISVVVETRSPRTSSVTARIEYSQDNHHYRSPLPDLIVEMGDLLRPLPLSNFNPSLVFTNLWEHCELHQRKRGEGNAIVSKIRPVDGLKMRLNSFRLPDDKSDKNVSYMFGLPPNHFVLILCVPEFSSMKIAIDSVEIFPVVYRLLTTAVDV